MPPKVGVGKSASRSSLAAAGASLLSSSSAPKSQPAGSISPLGPGAVKADVLQGLLAAGGGPAKVSVSVSADPGSLVVHQAELTEPAPFSVVRERRSAADEALASKKDFSSEASMLGTMRGWACKVTLHGKSWDVYVRGISAPGGSSGKVALFLHGLGVDRSAAFWAKFWLLVHEAGYHILTLDMPGAGQSAEQMLPARNSSDELLVLAVVKSFTDAAPGQVSCFADSGGAAAFIRAFCLQPNFFSGHHILTNPIIGDIPGTFKQHLEQQGTDLYIFFADGWGKTDQPFKIATAGAFLMYMEELGDRAQTCFHRAPGIVSVTPGLPFTNPPEYLLGVSVAVPGVSRSSSFFCLVPSEELKAELVKYLSSPRREPVKENGPSAPAMTALEMGEVNESFRVFVRVRPYLQREQAAGSKSCVVVKDVEDFPRQPPPQRIQIKDPSGAHHAAGGNFVFDRVFEPGSQAEVFQTVGQPLVETALQGTNVTMFAYGQTGTGKTFTMEGPSGDEGLMHNCIHQLFAGKSGSQSVYFQYVQLYNADFKDLLEPESNKSLAVEEGPKFMKVRNAKMATASSAQQLLSIVAEGAKYRASGKTNMNDASSRSHAILSIILAEDEPENGTVMYLVDLAGSERVKRSGATGAAFTEAANINQALSTLGRVVVGLVENDGKRAAHIAYKDNPLTYLLKSGIGGNSQTALICCITAADDSLDESLNTLRFALQASHVKNKVASKEKKDQQAAAAAAIEDSGNALTLSADGKGEVSLKGGPLSVRGSWQGDGPVVICIHDFGSDGSQFDGVIALLAGETRVLALTLNMTTEREDGHDALHSTILELLDWLGVAKPILFGRDFGAVICASFKVKHPTRAGLLILQNLHQDLDAPGYKKRMQKDPNYMMTQWMDCWNWIADVMEQDKSKVGINVKKLKGKALLFWPCHFKGVADTKRKHQQCGLLIEKVLKTKLVDSYGFKDAETVDQIRSALQKS